MIISDEELDLLSKYTANYKIKLMEADNALHLLSDFVGTLKLKPCDICQRRVAHPCDTVENFMESGPWDYACDMRINPSKYED
jgi:hypothetical protein